MVEARKPKLVLIPGGLAGPAGGGMISKARQAHRDVASKCILEIHAIIERMAARTADPEFFKERMALHFNMPATPDDKKRRDQMEGALDKMRKFEEDFNAHLNANGYRGNPLPTEKMVSTVEYIAHSAWSGFRHVFTGRRFTAPPDSA